MDGWLSYNDSDWQVRVRADDGQRRPAMQSYSHQSLHQQPAVCPCPAASLTATTTSSTSSSSTRSSSSSSSNNSRSTVRLSSVVGQPYNRRAQSAAAAALDEICGSDDATTTTSGSIILEPPRRSINCIDLRSPINCWHWQWPKTSTTVSLVTVVDDACRLTVLVP